MNQVGEFHSRDESSMDPFIDGIYEQLLAISADHISGREQERSSIAREIHDDIGQALVALRMDVSLLKQKLIEPTQMSTAELSHEIQQIETQIDNALETLHRVIAGLRTETLNRLGLRGAIEWQAHEFQVRTGIPVEFRSDLETIRMTDPNGATALFRIFQELLSNVARHAMASSVVATITEEKEFFLMQIEDNGRGINKNDIQKIDSYGLRGIKERAFLLHGDVEIQGFPDKGTTVTVRIPLPLQKFVI